ncbi:unnamed protein product [Triticum turgidum subsp. durum]|uniref:3'-5' exonuclease domain-containing protein n=1 Tax=Triticum turgidum subsp. durum TaxID=4567 RepID=A0A9R1PYW2_TRITD|nr:unnamed protein product [Triticum turgidum subsp. durum]
MAEEPSAKRHHAETSDKRSNLVDINVPGEKCEYTTTLKGVELHGNDTLEIVCTSVPEKADEVISRLWMKLGGRVRRIVGVGVHYTNKDEPPQKAAVLQLCVDELCLVYHIAAATKWPKRLTEMLQHEKSVTFAGFSIESDKEKLKLSGMEINPNKFIDIQRKWRAPYTGKEYDSLTDVAASVIHPFYKGMKNKINTQEDYKLWGTSKLPGNLIETTIAASIYTAHKPKTSLSQAHSRKSKAMAEEPSAKRHHGDTSNKSSNLADVHVPGEKHEYTKMLKGVELHGKETLEIVCTSEPDKADQMMSRPKRLKDFLQEEKLYTFVGFSIGGDKQKLGESGLEINPNNFIDMQRKWKDPKTDKYYDSLADVAGGVIHPFYELWATSSLPDNLITYAGIDLPYAMCVRV